MTGGETQITIEVALCVAPRQVERWPLSVAEGTTLAQVSAMVLARWQTLACDDAVVHAQSWRWGIWGRIADANTMLQDGDRLEAYRPLLVDPKVARRQRFARQGARGAGLFAKGRNTKKL
ncbi:hypothetical protein AAV94_08720 [Lampropedia cohaerens]|uniref:UPF0125 protein AAV94_08720 n=1 Tax=Lampropedia cohaerens TaxID=1610491 RepID=A0A0U1PZD5_9BURK|nr:RnfH family protein [Lampropedia cohaerens]KKW67715.1 hypothetical protein AAV94_08720 [Lampropedia cohaerens]